MSRLVEMTAEQHAEIQRCIVDLMRENRNQRAATLMAISTEYRHAPEIAPPPTNVVAFPDRHSRRVPTLMDIWDEELRPS